MENYCPISKYIYGFNFENNNFVGVEQGRMIVISISDGATWNGKTSPNVQIHLSNLYLAREDERSHSYSIENLYSILGRRIESWEYYYKINK